MTTVIGVRFRNVGKLYYFDPGNNVFRKGDRVVVETARGIECGDVGLAAHEVGDDTVVKPLKTVIRRATDSDIATYEYNRRKEKEAYGVCQKKIADHKLDMKLVDVEYAFDNSKILFYFTADGRVDFRELVKDLAGVFRTRIELRQIGVRDESKILGGIGICGKPLCCSTFLFDFQPVSIKMAKEQGKSLNPTKISGTCGRLMCCLKYEQNVYEELIKNVPRNGAYVQTPDGNGSVVEGAVLAQTVRVRIGEGPDAAIRSYPISSITVLATRQQMMQNRGKPPVTAQAASPAPAQARPPKQQRGPKQGQGSADRPKQNQGGGDRQRSAPKPQDARVSAKQGANRQPGQQGGARPARTRPPRQKTPKPQGEGG